MKARFLGVGLLVGSFMFAAPPAAARPLWGFELFGGLSGYDMQTFNDTLSSQSRLWGVDMPGISSGTTQGVGLRLWPIAPLLLRADLELMSANSSNTGVEVDIGPRVKSISGTWFFPSNSKGQFGLGFGLEWLQITGGITDDRYTITPAPRYATGGRGVGTHWFGEFTYPLTHYWSLSGILGFRQAEVDDLTYDTRSTGTKVEFSGPMLRITATCDFHTGK